MNILITSLKQLNNNSGLISKLIRRFLFTLILPTLAAWIIYLLVISTYYSYNTLNAQQTYLENSVSSLNLSVSNADNIFASLEGMPEILYYLEVYPDKREMIYSLVKYIYPQCESLRLANASIESIRIYSTKPSLLYADPFFPFSDMSLDESEKKRLEETKVTEIFWHVSSSTPNQIPKLYAYKKLPAYNFSNVIGYMELKMNPEILQDYFAQFENNPTFHGGTFALYRENQLLYSPSPDSALPDSEFLSRFKDNTAQFDYLRQQYLNYVTVPNLNLQLVITGSISDLSGQPGNLPLIMVSIFILLLLFLLMYFFSNITDLSRQITDFSTYIRNSNPDDLNLYIPDSAQYHQEYEELIHLIGSYNTLIRENSTLMSKVQKMELLSQDARYQALQAQIHPHFIYGTMENIRMLALQNRDKDVADMIFSLSTLIRQSLSISSKAVPLKEELEIAKHYLIIQKFRFGERLNYSFQIEDGWDDLLFPSFTLQPILENSVLYGVSQTFDDCELSVSLCSDEQYLYLKLSNTGQTITNERLTEINELLNGNREITNFKGNRNGVALYNIKERLRIYYHSHASIQMKLEENDTVTLITLERSNLHVSDTDS